ncbi:phage major capsid protein [Pseudonocardia asaccharolytica]|uniref:Phage capsid protein n=1 Tax=Pseudonocardia asaccharolytica DSM 44247 = NBRC 16224 TaxID=1123024 RepID=A0A511D6X0_9PSEU|nr:phage major capsid protein [Pseudonocardia asaccharolytica]GEL19354.1 phage capsid protein [Pseudonocardia asaccharolytica DSM 44247 = NBRC 16224]
MPFDNVVSRTDAEALVPEEVSKVMLGKAVEDSAVLSLFRRVPVSRKQLRFPVLSALPVAYFVDGDTGLKQTTETAWANKFLNVEEIATIMPIPENVIEDMDANVWDDAEPYLREAFARCLDNAVFFGVNAPSSWPTNLRAAAVAAGNVVTEGTASAAEGGYMGDLDNLIATVEEDGHDVSGFAAAVSARRKFRAARNTQGDRLDPGRIGPDLRSLDGSPIIYPLRGLWPDGGAAGENTRIIAGDFAGQFVVGVRQDITMKILDQAVITDNTGAIIFNLPQQDMIAVRLKFRVGWQVANTINNDQPSEAQRYPAAVMAY